MLLDKEQSMSDDTATATSKHLVIVGAGMAGIKLAHSCLEQQQQEDDPTTVRITILEANSYIGGRICHQQFKGHTVELGANWISGLDEMYDNPVWKLAQNVNLQGHVTDRNEGTNVLAMNDAGVDVTEKYMESLHQFDDIYERAKETCAERGIRPENDVDVQSLLLDSGWKKVDDLSSIERTVQYNVLEVWVADGLDNLSAAHDMRPGANDVDLGKEEVFVEDPRGFNTILQDMVRDIQQWGGIIHLNSQVERVQYSPENVMVIAKDLTSGQVLNYPSDAIVCTVSLGVLQRNILEFSPPLPDWKTQAINEIGMFVFSKVYARFDESFRPDKDQFAICSERAVRYPFWMRYKNADENLFMCFLGGKEAQRVESLSVEQVQDEIEELFRSAFSNKPGNDTADMFRPTAVAVTNWSQNPRFCGSYSYFPVYAFANVPEGDLASALTGTAERDGRKTLYFAGEAFDDRFNGWVQGAYRSGERVAKSILDDMRSEQS